MKNFEAALCDLVGPCAISMFFVRMRTQNRNLRTHAYECVRMCINLG